MDTPKSHSYKYMQTVVRWSKNMANKAKCTLFKRRDGKMLLYVAKALAEDSMFPFSLSDVNAVYVLAYFKIGDKHLIIEPHDVSNNELSEWIANF